MKRLFFLSLAVLGLFSCSSKVQKVNARYVPERMDDFVFENDFYCFRVYGKALEGNPTSPGFDFWAKNCDTLVADGRYRLYAEGSDQAYHHNLGNGKEKGRFLHCKAGIMHCHVIFVDGHAGSIPATAEDSSEWNGFTKLDDVYENMARGTY